MRANRSDMEHIKLRQRVLVNVDQRSSATILGEQVPVPLALGPIGLGGMMYGDGEIMACRARRRRRVSAQRLVDGEAPVRKCCRRTCAPVLPVKVEPEGVVESERHADTEAAVESGLDSSGRWCGTAATAC